MTAFHGKGGTATFSGDAVANIITWTAEATAKTTEATSMQETWETHLANFKNWTATIVCNLEHDGPDPDITTDMNDEDGAALILLTGLSGGSEVDYYNGTAIVTGLSISIDKNDVAKVTYTMQGSGALAEHQHA